MNTKHLSLFVQVINTGNITQVAKDLHVSQPAISMQIKRLEQEIGVPLFTTIGRNIALTDAGRIFLEYAESILSLEGQIKREMEEFRLGNRGRIVIAASPVTEAYFLPKKLLTFTDAYPDIQVDIETRTDEEIERLVQIGAVDIGLTLKFPEDYLFFRVTEFSRDRLIGVRATVPVRKQTLLIPEDNSFMLDKNPGLNIVKMSSIEAVKRFVKEGMGYGIILESAAKFEMAHGELEYWSEYTAQDVTANVITRPAERLSKSVWYFLHHIRK